MTYPVKPNAISKGGIVALPLVIGLTILIASVGIAISVLGFNEVINTSRFSDTNRALLYAESGVKDALQRIHFNKNYEIIDPSEYYIDFSGDSTVSTCETPSDGCATIKVYSVINGLVLSPSVIVSEGRYKDSIRTLNVGAVTATDSSGRLLNTLRYEVKNLPVVFTAQATGIGSTSVTLTGWVNPNGNTDVTAWFRYCKVGGSGCTSAPLTCNDSFGTPFTTVEPVPPFTGTSPTSFSSDRITGLTADTTYYYCAIVDDDTVSTNKVYGRLYTFKTTP